jgi:hypothetical protein
VANDDDDSHNVFRVSYAGLGIVVTIAVVLVTSVIGAYIAGMKTDTVMEGEIAALKDRVANQEALFRSEIVAQRNANDATFTGIFNRLRDKDEMDNSSVHDRHDLDNRLTRMETLLFGDRRGDGGDWVPPATPAPPLRPTPLPTYRGKDGRNRFEQSQPPDGQQ